jgi:hypothetical protein
MNLHSAHRIAQNCAMFIGVLVVAVIGANAPLAAAAAVIVVGSTRHEYLVHLDMVSGSSSRGAQVGKRWPFSNLTQLIFG